MAVYKLVYQDDWDGVVSTTIDDVEIVDLGEEQVDAILRPIISDYIGKCDNRKVLLEFLDFIEAHEDDVTGNYELSEKPFIIHTEVDGEEHEICIRHTRTEYKILVDDKDVDEMNARELYPILRKAAKEYVDTKANDADLQQTFMDMLEDIGQSDDDSAFETDYTLYYNLKRKDKITVIDHRYDNE